MKNCFSLMMADGKIENNKRKNIIYFDGVCMLCNRFVRWVIKHDKKGTFFFTTIQDKEMMKGIDSQIDTIVLKVGEEVYMQSDAVLKIVASFGGAWKLIRIFYVVPSFVRNYFYQIIAKNRFRIFGKADYCQVVTPENRDRFILSK